MYFSYQSMSSLMPATFLTLFFFKNYSQLFSDFLHRETDILPISCVSWEMRANQRVQGLENMPHDRIHITKTSLLFLGHSCQCHCHRYFFFCYRVIFNWLLQNFTRVLGIPSAPCARSFSATVLPHVENSWVTQNFLSPPRKSFMKILSDFPENFLFFEVRILVKWLHCADWLHSVAILHIYN